MSKGRADPNPWERQPKESAKAYAAFEMYRALGPARSIAEVAKECNKNQSLLNRWSGKWKWVARARAYDQQFEQRNLEDEEEAREEMRARHLQLSRKMQRMAEDRLTKMTAEMLEKPREVTDWLDFAMRVERECLGLTNGSGINIEVNTAVGVQQLTPDNVMRGLRLYSKAVSMLNDKQKAELEEYRKVLEGEE